MGNLRLSGGNFFQNLFSSLFNSSDPEAEKKRKLKNIAKRLSNTHYHFYKAGNNEVLPAFAKFFYDIYKSISPAQTMLQNVPNEAAFKRIVIEYFLSDRQKKIEEELTEETILSKSKTESIGKLTVHIKKSLELYSSDFDSDRITAIETMYSQFLAFRDFCLYDYYFMLKKFYSSLREKDFSGNPHFDKINAEYIADDLKDFIAVAWSLPQNADWPRLIKMFKDLRNTEPVSPAGFKKIISRLDSIHQAEVFEMMIQLATKNPDYKPVVTKSQTSIVESYLDKFKLETFAVLRKLEEQEKGTKVNDLLIKVFGTTAVLYMKNYTEQAGNNLEKKRLRGYLYYEPLNYLKGFLLEYVKKNIREYSELVLIRGKWATAALSAPISNAYNDLLSVSDAITVFDESLSEEGSVGIKIKTLLPRVLHDTDAANIVNRQINDVNDKAKIFILDSTRNLITIGKTIKPLLEDQAKKSPEMIINWKELEHFSDTPPRELGIEVYKKIYLFVLLMQTCMSTSAT
jgi:hypothetical protein